MKLPTLLRRRRLLEQPGPWLLLSAVALAAIVALALLVEQGLLREYEMVPAVLRGYTPFGTLTGALALGATLFTMLYSLRRRALQESFPLGRGSMAAWLWAHVSVGAIGLGLALVHAGYGVFSFEPSSGKLLLYVLLIIAGSGVLWRLLYAIVPRRVAQSVGNYAADESEARAQAQRIEIEKLYAGRTGELQGLANWVLNEDVPVAAAAKAAASLSAAEHAVFAEIARLAAERHAALRRAQRQRGYVRRLQGLRLLHVPLSLLFLALVPVHVLLAYDIPETLVASVPGAANVAGFEPASSCRRCHARVFEEWQGSMHAHALSSPVMVAQSNLAARTTLASAAKPDPQLLCVNCHGPLATRIAQSATLPFTASALGNQELLHEGVGCVVCHSLDADGPAGGGGLVAFQQAIKAGRSYFGPLDEPVGNAFHASATNAHFRAPENVCKSCHSVVYDRDGDGTIEKGKDLVLQNLYGEWEAYRRSGGAHCIDCHMPELPSGRAAEAALIPWEQDQPAPARRLRSHRFVGPDYPIDSPALRDRGRPAREVLLRSAATLKLSPGSVRLLDGKLALSLELKNVGAGHNLPGGFAFVRQMWLELSMLDSGGRLLSGSGTLAAATDDLCDAETLSRQNPLHTFVAGCAAVDTQLVNFQQKLLDRVEPARDPQGKPLRDALGDVVLAEPSGAQEVVVQHLSSGSVARRRPFDGKPVAPLAPGQSRVFDYQLPIPSGSAPQRVVVRLLFRAVPPYFLRALSKEQTPQDGTPLESFIPNLEVNEMARLDIALAR